MASEYCPRCPASDPTAEIFLGIKGGVGSIRTLGVSKADKIREEGFFTDVV